MTKSITNPAFLSLSSLLAGIKLLSHPALRKFLLIPLLINLILYTGVFALGYYSISGLIQQFIPSWLSWLDWILWPLFFISFMVIAFFSFSLLANLIAAPYYNQLSAKTLEIVTGKRDETLEAPWNQVFFGELHRIGYIAKRVLPLLLLSLIPVVNLIAPLLWATYAAWAIGMEYLAYPLQNRGMEFPDQLQFLKQQRLGSLSFGAVTGIGLSLPVINLLIAPAAVIGATIYIHRLQDE